MKNILAVTWHNILLTVCIIEKEMGRFSLARLLACGRYERLTSEDYLRLGLCQPDSCLDCASGHGHYVKSHKRVS